MRASYPLTLITLTLLAACERSELTVTTAQVRTDFGAGLNAASGWAVPVGGEIEIAADQPFRLRFEVEASRAGGSLGLEARRNDGPWEALLARDFPYPDELSTPPVSIVSAVSYEHGEPTADLLSASILDFSGGAGVGLFEPAAPVPAGQSEWEWPVVIRRWADGAEMLEAGERVSFRLVDGTGRPLGAGGARPGLPAEPSVTLTVPANHLGGTYVETPGRLGPWQSSDGRLYFPMEPAETYNVLMMMTSGDQGATWVEADGANRPATDDLEGFSTTYRDGRIYLLHQISERTVLHAFSTSDAPGGEYGWTLRDELVAGHAEPPVQVASIEALPDGRLVAVYGAGNTLEVRVRGAVGGWSAPTRIHPAAGTVASGPQTALTADGVVHLAWTETNGRRGSALHTTLSASGAPAEPRLIASGLAGSENDVGAILPLSYLPETGRVAVLFRRADGRLAERRIASSGSLTPETIVSDVEVIQNAVDSDQVGADVISVGATLFAVLIDSTTQSLHFTMSEEPGAWSAPVPVVEDIRAQWVRGAAVRGRDDRLVYGVVYDAGSDGGSGLNRYAEIALDAR